MNQTQARLIQCFSAVFPDLGENEIPQADRERLANWDSLANFSLISVIEEEFGIQIDADDVDRFVSFGSVLEYLQSKEPAA
ncbi:MAG: acyl carrier protein [Isosphaeraceae bacterium]